MSFEKIRPFLRSLFLAMLGVGATQINSALDPIFARIADPSGPAYLWYAMRIEQLPLALFGIALVNALLPALSRTDNHAPFMRYAYWRTLLLMIPMTVALCTLPLVRWIYAHGAFNEIDVAQTTLCLQAYALGLLPQSLVMIRSAAFYARGDYRTPAIISTFAVVINILLNSIFVFLLRWGPASIALATAFSTIVQYGIQRWHYSQLDWN